MHNLLNRYGKQLFIFLCLLGLLPAGLTNSLWPAAAFPGTASFRWTYFPLDTWRYAFAALTLLTLGLGVSLRQRRLLLAVIPLILLSSIPVDRIGATAGYAPTLNDVSFDLAQATKQIAQLENPDSRFVKALTHFPPALPAPTLLLRQHAKAISSQQAIAEPHSRLQDLIRQEARAREQYRRRVAELQRQPPPQIDPFGRARAEWNRRMQAEQSRLERRLSSLAKSRAQARSNLVMAESEFAMALSDLHADIRLHQRWVNEKTALYTSLPYLIAASLLWLWFIWRHGVVNRVMGAFLVIALGVSLVVTSAVWSDEPWLVIAFVTLYPLAIGLIGAITVRMLFRVVQDNLEIWQQFETKALLKAGALALMLWTPFALILGLNLSFGTWMQEKVAAHVYCPHADRKKCDSGQQAMVVNSDPARDTLRDDVQVSIDKAYARVEAAALRGGAGVQGKTHDALALAKSNLTRLFNSVLPERLWGYHVTLKPEDQCGLLNFGCDARNAVLWAANAVYQPPRDRLRTAFEAFLTETQHRLSTVMGRGAATFQASVRGEARRASARTRKYLDFGLLVVAGVAVLSTALLFMVVTRALLLIFARVLFSRNQRHYTTITPMESDVASRERCKVDISASPQLSVDWPHAPLLVKKSFDVDNAVPESLWLPPQAGKWIFSRLANRCWALKRIERNTGGGPMAFRTSEGARFVTWEIPAGVEVAFRWDSFVAMSESARLGKTISLKLSTLVLEHVMLPSVRGPGLLIQRSYGEPSRDGASVAPERLLAWTFGTRFRIEASPKLLSTYLDHCQMRAHVDGQALLDAPRERRGGQGLFRELLRLMRP